MIVSANSSPKNIYLVIGMARSGTSAIARGLKALGIELGENLAPARDTWNPKGFFEDTDIVYKVNRGVLFALNYTWMSVNRIDELCKHNPELVNLKKLAKKLLNERMENYPNFGFKDPRTAKVLPFWQEVFAELNLQDYYIIVSRNPLSSAYSYQRVSGTDIELGLFLWVMHMLPAIEATQGKKRIMVSFERMMENPQAELMRIKSQLKLPTLINKTEIESYANDFLDNKLRHFDHTEEDLLNHPSSAVAPICVKMHDLFKKLASDQMSFDSAEFLENWQQIKIEFDANYPLYCYLDKWQKRYKNAERELRTIHKSIPWKLIFPLRLIDNVLRKRRRSIRSKRRLVKSYD